MESLPLGGISLKTEKIDTKMRLVLFHSVSYFSFFAYRLSSLRLRTVFDVASSNRRGSFSQSFY